MNAHTHLHDHRAAGPMTLRELPGPLPLRGLPGPLPAGERLLWQGAPDFRSFALRAFHIRKVAVYFAVLCTWSVGQAAWSGGSPHQLLMAALPSTLLGLSALALLVVIAWLVSRTTVYSITSKRVLMQIGIALPITFNLPFPVLASASLKLYPDGSGNIPLSLTEGNRLAYVVLWPHARPWRLGRAEPTLRFVADAGSVAQILSRAVAAAAPATTQTAPQASVGDAKATTTSWPLSPAAA